MRGLTSKIKRIISVVLTFAVMITTLISANVVETYATPDDETVTEGYTAEYMEIIVSNVMNIYERINSLADYNEPVIIQVKSVTGTINGEPITFAKQYVREPNQFRYSGTLNTNDKVILTVKGTYDSRAHMPFEYTKEYTVAELNAGLQTGSDKSGINVMVSEDTLRSLLVHTVNIYDETGTTIIGSGTRLKGRSIEIKSMIKRSVSITTSKDTAYSSFEADKEAATITKYTFAWSDMAEGSDATYGFDEVIAVNSNIDLKATFIGEESSALYSITNPETVIEAGADIELDEATSSTNAVAGTIDYFEEPGSTDRAYVYGTLMSVPDMNGSEYTNANGEKVAVNIDSSKEYIRWYSVKSGEDVFEVEGVRALYPTVTYVLDGKEIGTTSITPELGFSEATGNYTTTLDGTPEVITEKDGSFSGWLTSADGTTAVTSVSGNKDVTVYGYTLYTTTVNYVKAGETVPFDTDSYTGRVGTTNGGFTSPTVAHFTADKEEITADEVRIGDGNKTITVVYTEDAKGSVIVRYVYDDENETEAAETKTFTGYVGEKAGTESLESPAIEGYEADLKTVALDLMTYTEDTQTITVKYAVKTFQINYLVDGETVNIVTAKYGANASLYINEVEYSVSTGYVFSGWKSSYTSDVVTEGFDVTGTSIKLPIITYILDGVVYDEVTVTEELGFDKESNTFTTTLLETPSSVLDNNETFSGWVINENGTDAVTELSGSGDTTVYGYSIHEEEPTEEGTTPSGEVEGDGDEAPTEAPTTESDDQGEVEADTETADRSRMMLFTILAALGVFTGTAAIAAKKKQNEEA